MRPLRTAILLLACCVLGAATTVGVAWVLSYFAAGHDRTRGYLGDKFYFIAWNDAQNTRCIALVNQSAWRGVSYFRISRRRLDDPYMDDLRSLDVMASAAPRWSQAEMNHIARLTSEPPKEEPYSFKLRPPSEMLVCAGWPWPAVWCHAKAAFAMDVAANPGFSEWDGPGVETMAAGGYDTGRGHRAADDGTPVIQPTGLRVPLPYQVLWRGMIQNALLYGVAWFGLIWLMAAPRRMRRTRRIRRKQCVKCAYDISRTSPGNPCPECGLIPTPRTHVPASMPCWARRAIGALVLGAFTTIVIAWVAALWFEPTGTQPPMNLQSPVHQEASVLVQVARGAVSRSYSFFVDKTPTLEPRISEEESGIPAWALQEGLPWHGGDRLWNFGWVDTTTLHAMGWPCRALWSRQDVWGDGVWYGLVSGVIEVPTWLGLPRNSWEGQHTGVPTQTFLPIRPIWSGLAVNVGAFTLAWYGVLSMIAALRRRKQDRRSRLLATSNKVIQ